MSLDWFSGLVGYDGSKLRLDKLLSLSVDGELRWEKELSEQVEGSWSARLMVGRDASTADMRDWAERESGVCVPVALRLSGNPVKFLQGHNVFGPSVAELGPVIQETVRRFPEVMRPVNADADGWPALHRSRVDIAVMVDLGSSDRVVHEWLHVAGGRTRSRHGRAMVSGETVYWGMGSRRWSLKAYCKFCELAAHRPPEFYDELRAYTEGKLRLELQLRRPELKDRGTLEDDLLWEYYEKVVIGVSNEKMAELGERVEQFGLPRRIQDVLDLWLLGKFTGHGVPSSTFYRWRKVILEVVGVDISLPRNDQLPDLARLGFDVEFLRSRQVRAVPEGLQGLLFRGEKGPRWKVA